jgi:hypothetical protein
MSDDIETRVVTYPWDKGVRRCVPWAGELPACGPSGVRCKGGVSSSQALAWNRRTCRLDTNGQLQRTMLSVVGSEGEPQVSNTTRGRVPMRDTGADRLVVAMKAL